MQERMRQGAEGALLKDELQDLLRGNPARGLNQKRMPRHFTSYKRWIALTVQEVVVTSLYVL